MKADFPTGSVRLAHEKWVKPRGWLEEVPQAVYAFKSSVAVAVQRSSALGIDSRQQAGKGRLKRALCVLTLLQMLFFTPGLQGHFSMTAPLTSPRLLSISI
jgi:hypothetical protein